MSVSSIVVRVAVCFLSAISLSAQCATSEVLSPGPPGVLGEVNASVVWDRDGAGPLPPLLVLGGFFQSAGGIAAAYIAAFDPTTGTWSSFGSGMEASVWALAVLPNGDLIAGGEFLTAGGVAANRIARWDGVSWSPLGAGCSGRVAALAVLPNGDLVAGGLFSTAGGITTNGVARWNGAAWAGLAGGVSTPFPWVNSLHVLANGDLVVGGSFTTAGGVAANNIARWDGSAWSALGAGLSVFGGSLATLPNGDLVAANGIRVERWDGNSWGLLGVIAGSLSNGAAVLTVAVLANGDLVIGGAFQSVNGVPALHIARWNGLAWTAIDVGFVGWGSVSTRVGCIEEWPNGDLFAGGTFAGAGSLGAASVARLVAGSWAPLGPGFDRPVEALVTMPNGDVVAGGSFLSVASIAASQIARWNGTSWQAIGPGVASPLVQGPVIRSLAVAPNGDLLCAGRFYGGMGVGANSVARWDGSTWSPLNGAPGIVMKIDTLPDGSPVVVGTLTAGPAVYHAFRWDGSAWLPLGTPLPGPGDAVLALSNGDVLVGGRNFAGNFYLWRWDGSAWSPFATFIDGEVYVMVEADNGDVIVGGRFTYFANMFANRIARWNGTSWSPLGAGLGGSSAATSVRAIGELPNGELVVGGTFETAGGVPAQGLARWSATGWSAMAPGSQSVTSLAITPRGEIVMGGYFAGTGITPASYFAYLATNCPAQAATFGAGCGGSSGVNVLASTAPAWVGATARSAASSLPSVSIAAIVRGFSTLSLPLASLLPTALPGCDLLVQPDSVDAAISDPAGALSLQLVVPNSTAIAGLVYHEQVVSISTADGSITSTNGLTLTVGTL